MNRYLLEILEKVLNYWKHLYLSWWRGKSNIFYFCMYVCVCVYVGMFGCVCTHTHMPLFLFFLPHFLPFILYIFLNLFYIVFLKFNKILYKKERIGIITFHLLCVQTQLFPIFKKWKGVHINLWPKDCYQIFYIIKMVLFKHEFEMYLCFGRVPKDAQFKIKYNSFL